MEIVFENTDGTNSFSINKRKLLLKGVQNYYSFGNCYQTITSEPLADNFVNKVVTMARIETKRFHSVDDLDIVPDSHDSAEISRNIVRFTHAFEHLAISELTKRSSSALFKLLIAHEEGGKTSLSYLTTPVGTEYFVQFSFRNGLALFHEVELEAIIAAGRQLSGL